MTNARYGNPRWFGPLATPTGFAEEGRGFVHWLRRLGVPLSARPLEQGESAFLPLLAKDFPDQVVALNEAVTQPPAEPYTAVVHGGASPVLYPPRNAAYSVARTMWETDGLTPTQVATLNLYDEVWVPSRFNQETFARAGVRVPLIVVPGGVDTAIFKPSGPALQVDPGTRSRVFLSIFEWSHRKAPDVLLRAWAEAFGPDDDVTLLLRCYPRNGFGSIEDLTADIDRRINELLASLGRARAHVAPITVVGRHLSPKELPALYRAADCYVSPTRGEGWGRPLMEAMAVGLPVIATRWSAPLEFLDDDNSLLIDIDGLSTVDERMDVATYRGQRWAEPSPTHLARLLRIVADDPARAAAIGRKARKDVVDRWQWKRAAGLAAAALARIGEQLPSTAARRARSGEVRVCTVVTRRDLPAARVLCESVTEHHAGVRPTVLLLDDPGTDLGTDEPFDTIDVTMIGIETEQFAKMALVYSATELCDALKPWLLAWALKVADTAIYLDRAILVTGPLDEAIALAGQHDIVLTPHVLTPVPRDGKTPSEADILASGIFNLGFIAVGPSSLPFLDAWKERLVDDGFADQQDMREACRRWVDFVPGCFRHLVWRDPGANVAAWNLHERRLDLDAAGPPKVDGKPAVFFNFSGYDPRDPEVLSRHQGDRPRVLLRENGLLRHLAQDYAERLLKAGFLEAVEHEYGFGRLPSGELLTPERRRELRTALFGTPPPAATTETADSLRAASGAEPPWSDPRAAAVLS